MINPIVPFSQRRTKNSRGDDVTNQLMATAARGLIIAGVLPQVVVDLRSEHFELAKQERFHLAATAAPAAAVHGQVGLGLAALFSQPLAKLDRVLAKFFQFTASHGSASIT